MGATWQKPLHNARLGRYVPPGGAALFFATLTELCRDLWQGEPLHVLMHLQPLCQPVRPRAAMAVIERLAAAPPAAPAAMRAGGAVIPLRR